MSENNRIVWAVCGGFADEGLSPPLACFESEESAREFVANSGGRKPGDIFEDYDFYHVAEVPLMA